MPEGDKRVSKVSKYFGRLPGQSLSDLLKEVRALPEADLQELADLVPAE